MPISEKEIESIERSIIELTKAIKDLAGKINSLKGELGIATRVLTSSISDLGKR